MRMISRSLGYLKMEKFNLKISFNALVTFFNERSAREKKMLFIMGLAFFIVADYWMIAAPVLFVSQKTMPGLSASKQELKELRDDLENRVLIDKNWSNIKQKNQTLEQALISADEMPALLENLSKQAREAGLRIISLKPGERSLAKDNDISVCIPIEIHALAGTHELGFFVEKLENGKTFFRVQDLRIAANPNEAKRHLVQITLEVYQKK